MAQAQTNETFFKRMISNKDNIDSMQRNYKFVWIYEKNDESVTFQHLSITKLQRQWIVLVMMLERQKYHLQKYNIIATVPYLNE